MNELSTDKITYDPNTGQRFVYVGAGKSADNPEAIVAYSPSDANGRAVVFADGSVQVMSAEKFQEALGSVTPRCRAWRLPRTRTGTWSASGRGDQTWRRPQQQPLPSRNRHSWRRQNGLR